MATGWGLMRNSSQEPAGGAPGHKGRGIQGSVCLDNGERPWGEPATVAFYHERATESQRWKRGALALLGLSQALSNQRCWAEKFICTYLPKFQNWEISHKNPDFQTPWVNQMMCLHSTSIPDGNHWLALKSQLPWAWPTSLP